mmetsp:Transcript_9391/g.24293  ORF Transcript_9391/g.24293 Transcript_9391/m.24293 type:complete len:220 (-) Transcript_9391:129-788(-)
MRSGPSRAAPVLASGWPRFPRAPCCAHRWRFRCRHRPSRPPAPKPSRLGSGRPPGAAPSGARRFPPLALRQQARAHRCVLGMASPRCEQRTERRAPDGLPQAHPAGSAAQAPGTRPWSSRCHVPYVGQGLGPRDPPLSAWPRQPPLRSSASAPRPPHMLPPIALAPAASARWRPAAAARGPRGLALRPAGAASVACPPPPPRHTSSQPSAGGRPPARPR